MNLSKYPNLSAWRERHKKLLAWDRKVDEFLARSEYVTGPALANLIEEVFGMSAREVLARDKHYRVAIAAATARVPRAVLGEMRAMAQAVGDAGVMRYVEGLLADRQQTQGGESHGAGG